MGPGSAWSPGKGVEVPRCPGGAAEGTRPQQGQGPQGSQASVTVSGPDGLVWADM